MIEVRTILEIAGFPKEHVVETMQKVVKIIKEHKEIKILKLELVPVKEVKKLFSTFADLTLEFKEMSKLIDFCFDFMPSSVEIIKPEKLQAESKIFEELINDLLAKLHQYELVLRTMDAENKSMKRKLNVSSQEQK